MRNFLRSTNDIKQSIIENIINIFSERNLFCIHKNEKHNYGIRDISYINPTISGKGENIDLKESIRTAIIKHEKRVEFISVEFNSDSRTISLKLKIRDSKEALSMQYEY